jgi:hypothetical protein
LIKNITLSFIWENLRMEGTQPVRARAPSFILYIVRINIGTSKAVFVKKQKPPQISLPLVCEY